MKKNWSSIVFSFLLCVFLSCSSDNNGSDDDTTSIDDDGGSGMVDKSGNLLATGASANDILSNSNFDTLQIEIAFVTGFRPTDEAMNAFENYLRVHTFKENIQLIFNELPSPNEETLELQEIADLEEENRTAYNNGNTLAIYIYFADAPSDGDNDEEGLVTLGAVYRNTSMVIFERTIRNLAGRSLTITNADVETATLNHEFGHLFGLVNLGTTAINDHEDPNAMNHCVIDPCLMRAELVFNRTNRAALPSSFSNDLRSSCTLNGFDLVRKMETNITRGLAAAPTLDAECMLDLERNGGRPVDVSSKGF